MTKEQFGLWKHEPITKWFFDYLASKRLFLKGAALDMWLADPSKLSETVRGQIIELEEICDDQLFAAIDAFYQERQEIHGTESQGTGS